MTKRAEKGVGLFLHRDSEGKSEMAPGEYVRWAVNKAKELGVRFGADPETIKVMRKERRSRCGNLFLDDNISGNHLSRPALDALKREVESNLEITHIFVARRDRLARPGDPLDGMLLERWFRERGVTVVYMDRVCAPLVLGEQPDFGEDVGAMLEFHQAGKERRDLARKIILAQVGQAKLGHAIGGVPPLGFKRCLVDSQGGTREDLADGEHRKIAGHHVVWVPHDHDHPDMTLLLRIIDLIETTPASRIADILNKEKVPPPATRRFRKRRSNLNAKEPVWYGSTITALLMHPLLTGIVETGRRSQGDQLRMTPTGPRALTDSDRDSKKRPKRVRNDPHETIQAAAAFEPILENTRILGIRETLKKRGGTQRGKPRAQDPSQNPLGARVYDLNCGWPMYREQRDERYKYVCGLYAQSSAKQCDHNAIEGPVAASFAIASMRQRLVVNGLLEKVRARVRQMAEQEAASDPSAEELAHQQKRLAEVEAKLNRVEMNLAFAETEAAHKAIFKVFGELDGERLALSRSIEQLRMSESAGRGIEAEVEAAMSALDRLPALLESSDPNSVCEAIRIANVKIYVGFVRVPRKKIFVNRIQRGKMTFGSEPPPIELHQGPTSRESVERSRADGASGQIDSDDSEPPPAKGLLTTEARDSPRIQVPKAYNVPQGRYPIEEFTETSSPQAVRAAKNSRNGAAAPEELVAPSVTSESGTEGNSSRNVVLGKRCTHRATRHWPTLPFSSRSPVDTERVRHVAHPSHCLSDVIRPPLYAQNVPVRRSSLTGGEPISNSAKTVSTMLDKSAMSIGTAFGHACRISMHCRTSVSQ